MKTLALIMAGGANKNLSVLTQVRAEAALPFGGKFRIVDFALSNCSNSEIYSVGVLTQYMPRSLNDHIGVGKPWELDRTRGGVRLLQPYLGPGITGWEKGTADAVRRNMDYVDEQRADAVLILGGNHVYKMDYRTMLRYHQETGADVTIGIRSVNPFETHRFGIVTTDANMRVLNFQEKPKRSRETVASMGIYVFKTDVLRQHLKKYRAHLDFGRDVLPAMIAQGKRVFAYKYEGYWANVGTLQAYWEANMALLAETPALDMYDPNWVIHTPSEEQPPVKVGANAHVENNLLSNGAIIDGVAEHSVLSSGVYIAEGATVRNSIIMHDCKIGAGAVIDRAIIDKNTIIGENAHIGFGDSIVPNKDIPDILNTGLTVIGKNARIPAGVKVGRNVVVEPHTVAKRFKNGEIPSGETVR